MSEVTLSSSNESSSNEIVPLNIPSIKISDINNPIRKSKIKQLVDFFISIFKISNRSSIQDNLIFDYKSVNMFKFYYHLSKNNWFLVILATITSLFSGLSAPLLFYITGSATNDVIESSSDRLQQLSEENKKLFFIHLKNSLDNKIKTLIFIGTTVSLAKFLSNFLWDYIGLKQHHFLKENYFNLILKQNQEFFDLNNAYEFSTKVQAQLDKIELSLGSNLGVLIESCSKFFIGLYVAFHKCWKLTAWMLCISPLIMGCTLILIFYKKYSSYYLGKNYEIAGGVAEELLYNIKTVMSFANFDYEKDRFGNLIDEIQAINKKSSFILSVVTGLIEFFTYSSYCIAIIKSKEFFSTSNENTTDNKLQPGDLITITFTIISSISGLGVIAPNISTIEEACIASSDYFNLLEKKRIKKEKKLLYKPSMDSIKGKIEMRNISFKYPFSKEPILDDINLTIEPGKKIAIVGESGCGKSTIANLLERLYDPLSGEILLDGVNVNCYDLKYYRSLIGYVQQEPVLFNTSIKQNIIFGREKLLNKLGNGYEDLIIDSCNISKANDFIKKLSSGYDYIVGINGSKLSGGQKQRIAIARALLCKPKILILDEATSALDNETECKLCSSLDNVIKNENISTIVISHKLSNILNADLIYVLNNGKICEKGTHEELIKLKGYYFSIVKSQINSDNNDSNNNIYFKNTRKRKSSIELCLFKDEDQIKVKEKKSNFQIYRIFKFLKNKKKLIFLAVIGALLNGIIPPTQGFLLPRSIVLFSSLDKNKIKHDSKYFIYSYVLMAIFSLIFSIMKNYNFDLIGNYLECLLRKLVVNKYLEMDMSFFDKDINSPGALLSKLSLDTTQLNSIILSLVGNLVESIGSLTVGLAIGYYYDWRIMSISLGFMPFIIISRFLENRTRQGGRNYFRKINIEAGAILSECVINTKTIYSFNFQKSAVSLYINTLKQAKMHFFNDSFTKGILIGIGNLSTWISRATVYYFSSKFIINETLSFADITIIPSVVVMLSSGLIAGLKGLTNLGKFKRSFESLFSIIDSKSQIDVTKNGNEDKIKPSDLKGKIEFKNVTFSYPTNSSQIILDNVSFVIHPGEKVALVGYSGCGKSTILQLIERFYDLKEGNGEILIDGINIKEYNLLELRQKIGLVGQEPVIFKGSVEKNILYGNLNSTDNEIKQAAVKVGIEKFFIYNTFDNIKESPVSGGEKQRIAIARVFLKNPTILLLDEATSALDKINEIAVQKSLNELSIDRTCITISHKLNTITDCDKIFFIKKGKLIEQGCHKELIQANGDYADLYKISNSY